MSGWQWSGRLSAQDEDVGERGFLAAGLRAVEVRLDLLQHLPHFGQFVDFPILLRPEANAGSIRSATLVSAAKRCHRRLGESGSRKQRRLFLVVRKNDGKAVTEKLTSLCKPACVEVWPCFAQLAQVRVELSGDLI